MTNDMCGIEAATMRGRPPISVSGHRVPPLQGGEGLFGPSSQGVALGWRVVAPLARKTGTARAWANVTRSLAQLIVNLPQAISQPEGLQLISPGQRPGNSAKNNTASPERATPGNAHAQARDFEQTIAGNGAEILED